MTQIRSSTFFTCQLTLVQTTTITNIKTTHGIPEALCDKNIQGILQDSTTGNQNINSS